MSKHERLEPPTFRERTVNCPECGGSGVRMGASYNDIECFDCSGEGQWPAQCAECLETHPLNADGLCSDCALSLVDIHRTEKGIWL